MRIYRAFSNLILILFVCLPFYSNAEEGKVVFLIGTSSAGKSTLGKNFASMNEEAVFFEHDKIWTKKELAFLTEKLGEPFNHFLSIYGSSLIEMSFRNRKCQHIAKRIDECTEKDELIPMLDRIKLILGPVRAQFYEETTQEIVGQVHQLFNDGKIIIIDKIINQDDINLLSKFNPYYVVVYYPFTLLPQRLWMRNQDAVARNDSYDYRHYLEAYLQYAYLFEASLADRGDALDTLTQNQVFQTLDLAFDLDPCYLDLDDFHILSENFDLSEYSMNLLATLKIVPEVNQAIVSKFGNDLVIRTDKLNPLEACQELESFLSKQ